VDVLCNKLRQMRAGMANLLFVVCKADVLAAQDLPIHLAWMRERAERSDPLFYERQGFLNPSDKYYERLSGLVLHDPSGSRPPVLWINPQARVRLTEQLRKVLERGWG